MIMVYIIARPPLTSTFFFFNDTATTEIYTLSLHDALPICGLKAAWWARIPVERHFQPQQVHPGDPVAPAEYRADRKSTRLNSSHGYISYAVFCLKKKKNCRCHRGSISLLSRDATISISL